MVIVLKRESPDHKNYIPLLGDTDKKGRRNGEEKQKQKLTESFYKKLS